MSGSAKHIVVIGGTSGIGLSLARGAMARGEEVTITGAAPGARRKSPGRSVRG